MSIVTIHRIGGLAGVGGPQSHIVSRGQVDDETISDTDRQALDGLFASPPKNKRTKVRDGFKYRITRNGQTIEVPEGAVPDSLIQCVRDELI